MKDQVTVKTIKRIDVSSAPAFEKELNDMMDQGEDNILVDMADTVYISSVGLRVLLHTKKRLNKSGGELALKNVGPQVMEVFDITGFSGFLNILDE